MNRKMRKPNNNSPVQSETLSLIKQQFFKTKMCPFQKNKNYCLNESNCHYAHSLEELKPMPNLRNTKLCEYVKKKLPCQNPNCKFAHDIDMLKPSVHLATYKSAICSFWGKGKCFNGNKCRFAHGNEDMKSLDELNKTMNSIKTESTPNQATLSTPPHQKSRNNGQKKKTDSVITPMNNNTSGNTNGNLHNNHPNLKGNAETDICNSSTNSFHTCEHFARGSIETTRGFVESMKQESQEERKTQENSNKESPWIQNRKSNNNTLNIREGTNIWENVEPRSEDEMNEHRNAEYEKFIGEDRFCENRNNGSAATTNNPLAHTYAFYKPSMNQNNGNNNTMHNKQHNGNLNRSNSNSMKEIIERMENMKISSYLENNDNYTETIKYLVRENAKLKQSLRNDYADKEMQNKNMNHFTLEKMNTGMGIEGVVKGANTTIEGNTSPIPMNCTDITKYFYTDEKQANERYGNNKNIIETQSGNLMNVATFEDTSNVDENLCNIIKTIDDILISQNVDSFTNAKNENMGNARKDSSVAFENTKDALQHGNNNTSEIFNGYENFFYNMKSFETSKNEGSDSNSNSNSNSLLTLEKKNSKETDILEQLFQQSIQSDQLDKKKNYFYQTSNNVNGVENYYTKRKSFQQEEMQTKKYEELFQKNNFKMHPYQQTIQQNLQKPSSVQNNIQQTVQPNGKTNAELPVRKEDFVYNNNNNINNNKNNHTTNTNRGSDSTCDVSNQEEFMYLRNNLNPMQVYSQNMNQTQMFCQGNNNHNNVNQQPMQNPTIKNMYKEKNTKLNSTEQDSLLMNDANINAEKLFELFSDKTQLIKKLKIFLSTELKNSENQKYAPSTKINNYSAGSSDHQIMTNMKNSYYSEPLYTVPFTNATHNANANDLMNTNNMNHNNLHTMNMNRTIDIHCMNNSKCDPRTNANTTTTATSNNILSHPEIPLYEMEMNMDKNIWNHGNHGNMHHNKMNHNHNYNHNHNSSNMHHTSCNSILSNNFNNNANAQLNEYTHPNYSSEWMNNNDNLDFFNLSKSLNMSRLN